MRQIFRIASIGSSALLIFLSLAINASAQNGAVSGLGAQFVIGNQVPFTQIGSTMLVQGDYVADGVGTRNVGSGVIDLSPPAGSTISHAFLTWAIIWDDVQPADTINLNGVTFTGTLLGTSGSPCWLGDGINFYYADVTGSAVAGNNLVSGMPSGLTNNAHPVDTPRVFPLAEGATLVMVFCHPDWDMNRIAFYGGAQTFADSAHTEDVGTYFAFAGGNPADVTAQTTFVMADGQSIPGGYTQFNGVQTSGPGTLIRTSDAFPGEDGFLSVSPTYGLWDTHTIDVSAFFPTGVATNADVTAGTVFDCLTWGVQVISVKGFPAYYLDIKANSCPNPLNINSGGLLPVSILGTAFNDAADIDPSTVTLNGVSPTGNATLSDQATPFFDVCGGDDLGCMDCTIDSADGFTDLNLKFNKNAIIASLGNVSDGDCIELTMRGMLYTGEPIFASDRIYIVDRGRGRSPKEGASAMQYELSLGQNTPNPFAAATTFNYTLPEAMNVQLEVFNTLGKRVAVVFDGAQPAGTHSAVWNSTGSNGAALSPGTYLYRLTAGEQILSKMLVITR